MMRCVRTMRKATEGIVQHWAKGTNGKIIDPIPNDQPMIDDEYFYWGILRGSGDMMKRKGHTYYFCDHAYFLPGHNNKTNWYRITKNAHTNSSITEQTPYRYEKYFAQDLAPWQTTGTQIIVCPPTGAIEWFFDAQQWLNGVLDALKQQTSREIVVRDKPMNPQVKTVNGLTQLSGFDKHKSQKPLEEDLKNAYCVITFNSMVAVKAICMGIPVVCGNECAAYPVANKIDMIESLDYPDREPWLWHLAHQQFTLSEMASGYAYNCIR